MAMARIIYLDKDGNEKTIYEGGYNGGGWREWLQSINREINDIDKLVSFDDEG